MGDQEDARPSKKARVPVGSGGLTAFALRLGKQLAEGDGTKDKNLAFSPLSVYTTLGLVAAGARGKTLDELLALLGASSPDDIAGFVRGLAADPSGSAGPIITYAYGVFHQKDMELTPAYRRTATESYKAELRAVNFAEVSTTYTLLSSDLAVNWPLIIIISSSLPSMYCREIGRKSGRRSTSGWRRRRTI
jgi:serpin B